MENPIRLHWLDPADPTQAFPPIHLALKEPNGLLAVGGDLSAERLLRAYAQGIFPWYNPEEPILWWSPDPRTILNPDGMHLSRSLQRAITRGNYAVTMDRCFGTVLDACAAPRRSGAGTWLGADMRRAYLQLHQLGYAHSVEIWRDGALIGGLYGVAIGACFFGESMFSRATDASKLALHWLCQQLQAWGFQMIDCQVASAHLQRLGAVEISRERFRNRLRQAVNQTGRSGHWQFDIVRPLGREHLPQ